MIRLGGVPNFPNRIIKPAQANQALLPSLIIPAQENKANCFSLINPVQANQAIRQTKEICENYNCL